MEATQTDTTAFFERFLVSDRDVAPTSYRPTSHKKQERDGVLTIDE
jgi:hypothetical protein